MKDVRKETEVPYLFHLCIIFIHCHFRYSGKGDAEQDKVFKKSSCGIETVSHICPLCKIGDELCGVVGLGR